MLGKIFGIPKEAFNFFLFKWGDASFPSQAYFIERMIENALLSRMYSLCMSLQQFGPQMIYFFAKSLFSDKEC